MAKQTKKPARRQHYVPRFYLRNFARESKGKYRIHVYDFHTKRAYSTTVENTGLEGDFYTTWSESGERESIDPRLTELEHTMVPGLKQLVEARSIDALTAEDRYGVALFCATISTRVPAMRQTLGAFS